MVRRFAREEQIYGWLARSCVGCALLTTCPNSFNRDAAGMQILRASRPPICAAQHVAAPVVPHTTRRASPSFGMLLLVATTKQLAEAFSHLTELCHDVHLLVLLVNVA